MCFVDICDWAERTIWETVAFSKPRETGTAWTKNLSLHLAFGAGSSFIACSSTIAGNEPLCLGANPNIKPTLNFNRLAGLDVTRVGAHTVTDICLVNHAWSRARNCGNVLLRGGGFDLMPRINC